MLKKIKIYFDKINIPGNIYEFWSSSSLADKFQFETFIFIKDESLVGDEMIWFEWILSRSESFFNSNLLVELVTGGTTVSNANKRRRSSWSDMLSPIVYNLNYSKMDSKATKNCLKHVFYSYTKIVLYFDTIYNYIQLIGGSTLVFLCILTFNRRYEERSHNDIGP